MDIMVVPARIKTKALEKFRQGDRKSDPAAAYALSIFFGEHRGRLYLL
jgi:hypothetical protein